MGADLPSLQRPPMVGHRYVVLRRVGRGGSASVYAAYDVRLRTWRAVKVLHAELAAEQEPRERFLLEAAAMANLEHPNVVRVTDVVHDIAHPYLVMEWLEGGSLAAWLRDHGPMPLDLAIDAMIEVCDALAFVHGHQVVHRDVNPRNVLIDRRGTVKLTDFGVARVSAASSTLVVDLERHPTEVGTVMGTEAYMAPEQRRDSATVDARADVYSAGATLYSLLTGRAPPDLATTGPADSRIRALPPLVAPIVVRACSYLPEDRHASAPALRTALQRIRTRLPPSETRDQLVPRAQGLPPVAPLTLEPDDLATLEELLGSGAVSGRYDGRAAEVGQPEAVERTVLVATGVAVVTTAVVVGILTVVLLLAMGSNRVQTAQREAAEAELSYYQVLRRQQELGDVDVQVREVFQRLDRAGAKERPAAAEAVYDVLRERGSSDEALEHARAEFLDAYSHWRQASRGLGGRIAIAAGWAQAPG